jgi:hypothetical protein
MLPEIHEAQVLAYGGGRGELLPKGLAARVGLHDGIDPLQALQVFRPLALPVARAGHTQRRYAVEPQRLRITLALDQDDVARVLGGF